MRSRHGPRNFAGAHNRGIRSSIREDAQVKTPSRRLLD